MLEKGDKGEQPINIHYSEYANPPHRSIEKTRGPLELEDAINEQREVNGYALYLFVSLLRKTNTDVFSLTFNQLSSHLYRLEFEASKKDADLVEKAIQKVDLGGQVSCDYNEETGVLVVEFTKEGLGNLAKIAEDKSLDVKDALGELNGHLTEVSGVDQGENLPEIPKRKGDVAGIGDGRTAEEVLEELRGRIRQ